MRKKKALQCILSKVRRPLLGAVEIAVGREIETLYIAARSGWREAGHQGVQGFRSGSAGLRGKMVLKV